MKKISLFTILLLQLGVKAQFTTVIDSSAGDTYLVIPGREYQAGALRRMFLGQNWRTEWTTPIRVPVIQTHTMHGGLTPVELGGGRQTTTLHVTGADGKRYVMRSVNKTYTRALPEIARGTFVEKIMNDQISTIHPFAAMAVPPMAAAAGVYHARPLLGIVPANNTLGAYKDLFSNMLVLVEERPDKTHEGAPNFGSPKDVDGSEKMIEKITGDNDVQMDQHQYLKSRLFDMFLGDWGRHIDNWRWAEFDSGKKTTYKPVPKDRDQTWARFEGLLVKLAKAVAGLNKLQTFESKINNLEAFNHAALDIDRRFTTWLTRDHWIDTAKALQAYLTDAVIEDAVKQLPPEVFAISGGEVTAALKHRRDDLPQYASDYYAILSKNVDIPGSDKHEKFLVNRLNDDETEISIFKIKKDESEEPELIASRIFKRQETDEVRLYGLDGNDVFEVKGHTRQGITVRMIGGPGDDRLLENSPVHGGTHRSKFYDNEGSRIQGTPETKIRLADTTYKYPFDEEFHFNHSGFSVSPGLNPFYRVFVGAAYKKQTFGWREHPYKSFLKTGVNYSLSEKSLHPYFLIDLPQLFGAWTLTALTGYDGSRRFNYFGTGNETSKFVNIDSYYFLRTENLYSEVGFTRPFAKDHAFNLAFGYDGIRLRANSGEFTRKPSTGLTNDLYEWKHFFNTRAGFRYSKLNDELVPTKGWQYALGAGYIANLKEDRRVTRQDASLAFFIPLSKKWSVYQHLGGATLQGSPEFYQLNQIGGTLTLRGYLRNRFYGNTTAYSQTELRWITDFKSFLFNGPVGLIALHDVGRVWIPGEPSNTWHRGNGFGLMVAPFKKMAATVYYTRSAEDGVFNIRVGRFF